MTLMEMGIALCVPRIYWDAFTARNTKILKMNLPDNPPIMISNRFCARGMYNLTQEVGDEIYGSIHYAEYNSAQEAFDQLSPGDVACVVISHGPLRVKGDW